jgi:HD-like signal output (HDOD) protein
MRLLFATANPNQPGQLADALLAHGCDWQLLAFARSDDAEWELEHTPVDAVVADLGMPGCEALLRRVQQLSPGTARLLLAPEDDDPGALRLMALVHGVLPRHLDIDALMERLQAYTQLVQGLSRPALRDAVGRVTRLPSPPRLYLALGQAMTDDSLDLADITALVQQSPVVAARVLQLANSAFYSRGRQIASLSGAVSRLGLRALRDVVLAAELYASPARDGSPAERVQQQALLAAWLAPRLLDDQPDADVAATAALLAGLGRLLPDLPPDGAEGHDLPVEDEAAAYLVGLWGLPPILQQAIAWQRRPRLSGSAFGVVGAVHVAMGLACGRSLDEGWLASCGVAPHLAHWRTLAETMAAA